MLASSAIVDPREPKRQLLDTADVAALPPQGGTAAVATTTTSLTMAPSSATAALGSCQRDAALPDHLRSALETIGMRTRFNVNRGYCSPTQSFSSPTSSFSSANSNAETVLGPSSSSNLRIGGGVHPVHFQSSRDTLHSVLETRSRWARTASAPSWGAGGGGAPGHTRELQPFGGVAKAFLPREGAETAATPDRMGETDGVRISAFDLGVGHAPPSQRGRGEDVENDDPSLTSSGPLDDENASTSALKRGRDAVLESAFMDEDEDEGGDGGSSSLGRSFSRPVHPLPSRRLGARTGGLSRTAANTVAVGDGLADYMMAAADGAAPSTLADDAETAEAWRRFDFSRAACDTTSEF